jgi:glycosyltransferase involved in cell wall biosynthesis
MRILHLSTSDSGGGAFRAAYRLHCGLKRLGQDSKMLVLRRGSQDDTVIPISPRQDFISRTRRSIRARRIWRDYDHYRATIPPGVELFSDDRSSHSGDIVRQLPQCDVINLHFTGEFLDYQSFFSAYPKRVSLVWRMADMNVFTGGCHYTQGCEKFTARCGACPQLGSSDEDDLSRRIWMRKLASFDQIGPAGMHIVGTSKWIAEQAKKSGLLSRFPVSVIANGLNVDEFTPRDKGFCRDLWNIPRRPKVVLFAAESVANPRKGFALLADAIAGIPQTEELLLLSVGSGKCVLPEGVRHLPMGKVKNDRMLSTLYAAADVFVIPSLQESFGQTVIESLACGTPVIGFNTGGIPDTVRPGQTGWLVPVGDSEALRATLLDALSDMERLKTMGRTCREQAVREYSLDVQANAYLSLYAELLQAEVKRAAGAPSPLRSGRALSVS